MTVYPRLLYGDGHPYGRPRDGSLKTIAAITRDDVVAFHKRLYTPGNSSPDRRRRHHARRRHGRPGKGAEGLEVGRAGLGRRLPEAPAAAARG